MLIEVLMVVSGLALGILNGFFGLGGGIVVVPVLTYLFLSMGLSQLIAIHLAIGTSLATMSCSLLVNSYQIYRANNLNVTHFWKMLFLMLSGSLLGCLFTVFIPLRAIYLCLAILCFYAVYRVWCNKKFIFKMKYYFIFPIGMMCSMFGISGGGLLVVFLQSLEVPFKQIIDLTAVLSFPACVIGACFYVYLGFYQVNLPNFSVGYVYLPGFLSLLIPSILAVTICNKYKKKISLFKLKKWFSLVMFGIGSILFFKSWSV